MRNKKLTRRICAYSQILGNDAQKACAETRYHMKFSGKKQGSAFLLVIICIMFLAITGVVVLSLSTDYLVSVITAENSTSNFYDAEQILAEVRTGVQERAMESAKETYDGIMTGYRKMPEETRVDRYSKGFLTLLAKSLGAPSGAGSESDFLETDTEKTYVCDNAAIKKLTKVPDAVGSVPGTDLLILLRNDAADGYSLTLKNLDIDYKSDIGYRSTIRTDMVIRVPDFHFDGDSTLNELKKYIVISDDTMTVSNALGAMGGTTGASFRGNIYTGIKDASANDTGIQVDSQTRAVFHSDIIVSRGGLDILTGSNVQVRANDGSSPSDLWLKNIKLSPMGLDETDLFSDVNINANANIEDSFVINDDKSKVTLGGSYYGYSYNKENDPADMSKDSTYSSAFLINGLNTTVNTPNLNKLILAGRAFVSKMDDSGAKTPSNIITGESLSVKSNQIAYLVPEEYLEAGHNPVISGEDEGVKASFNSSWLRSYLDSSEPVTKNYISSASGFTLIYYFLNFKDNQSANDYFEQYYSSGENKEALSDNARAYISTDDDSGMKLDASLFLIAGNIIHHFYDSAGAELKKANYYDNTGAPLEELLDDGIAKGKEYVGRQMTLLPAAGATMRLSDTAPPLAASKIIDFNEVDHLSSVLVKNYSELSANVIIAPGDYTVDTSSGNRGLIVAKGNVTVQNDFTGLIISGEKVEILVGGITLEYNQVLISSLLKEIAGDNDLAKYFRGIASFDGASVEDALSQNISYQNWSRNED